MRMNEPAVTSDDFISFLYFLIREISYEAKDIVSVVEKPWKYQSEYQDFLDDHQKEEDKT